MKAAQSVRGEHRSDFIRPLVEAMALVNLICDQVAEGGEPAAKH